MSWRTPVAVFATLALVACRQQQPDAPPSTSTPPTQQSSPVQLDAKVCEPATDSQKAWLTPEFQPFLRFAIACPVRASGGPPALYVVSVNGFDVEASLPATAPAPHLPKALLTLPDGRRVGQLPYVYPFDAPVRLQLTFTNWTNGLPRTIELKLEDPTVAGNSTLPSLTWNDTLRQFAEEDAPHGN